MKRHVVIWAAAGTAVAWAMWLLWQLWPVNGGG